MSMGSIRMDVLINEGCDCGSVKEYGEKMDEGGRGELYRPHEDGGFAGSCPVQT